MDEFDDDDIVPEKGGIQGTVNGMFIRQYLLDPVQKSFTGEDLITVLRLLNITLSPSVFKRLPEHTKRHFVEINRKGERTRYGSPRQ